MSYPIAVLALRSAIVIAPVNTDGCMFLPSLVPLGNVGVHESGVNTILLCGSSGLRQPASPVRTAGLCQSAVSVGDCSSSKPKLPAPAPWWYLKPAQRALLLAPSASSFLFSALDSRFPRMPSDSIRISTGGQAPRCPTRKRRLRLWATPKNCASSMRHARPYPSLSISDRSCRKASPFSLESAPGTFSQRNHRGRISRTARMYSNMSPEAPLRPSRFPAMEKDWHGLPPTTRSTAP